MAGIELDRVGKVYADGTHGVRDLRLEVMDRELMVLVGPSGCGKTTALRLIAGLEKVSAGEVRIDGQVVNDVPARDRDIAMVFQSYALYPHLSVFDNIAFGLTLRRMPRDEVERRVGAVAEMLALEPHLRRKPRQLSGGQRQRVAMGRAIVREPRAFLMDEPLSNLDAQLRVRMRAQIARLQRRLGVTTVYVTHDQSEAMTLGDRVAVLRDGVLQQVASPQDVYDQPANMFVAGFLGSPGMNMIAADLRFDDGTAVVAFGATRIPLPAGVLHRRPALRRFDGATVAVGIRPEDLQDAALDPGTADPSATIDSVADLVEAMGADVLIHFPVDAPSLHAGSGERATDGSAGQSVLVGRFSPRSRIFAGQPITVRVNTENLHFFDQQSGEAIWR